jgi:CHAT domain-containing protein
MPHRIQLCQAALALVDRAQQPELWAALQLEFGNSLAQNPQEEQADNLEAAIVHYQAALTVYTREAMPTNWATTQNNLANVYQSRYERSGEERWATLAEEAYQAALTVYTREAMPTNWATTQNNLANVYQRRYERSGEERWATLAEEAFQAALTVYTREAMPTDWAMTQNNLAIVYRRRYERSGEERWATLAEEAFQIALAIFTPAVAPSMANRIGRNLARLYTRQGRWGDAHNVYTIALTAAENQYLAAPGDSERRHLMAEHADLYRADAQCLVHMGHPARAWVRLESGQARALGEAIGLEALASLHHGSAAADELRALRRAVQQADYDLQAADARFSAVHSQAEQQSAATARRQARQTLETAYATLRVRVATLGLEPAVLDATTLTDLPLPPNTAAVTLLLTPAASQALILHGSAVRTMVLPETLSLTAINRLVSDLPPQMAGWIDTYNTRWQALRALELAQGTGHTDLDAAQHALEEANAAWHVALDAIAGDSGAARAGWYFAYRLAYETVRGEDHAQAERAALNAWKQTVEHARAFLAEHLWQPLAAALPASVTQVLFVPTGPTALLPVHAAAPDHLTVAYTPSLGIWQQCAARVGSHMPHATRTLFLATPANDLFFTQAEAEWLRDRAVAQGHQVTWLERPQATVANVAAQARGHAIVHFAGHAGYHWHAPLASALVCVDGPLTLTAIRQAMDLRLARLITLSACSTGLSDVFASGEEFVGLPAALLETGAPAVVASLWPVHDVSTAFVMDRFYELWLGSEERTIAEALAAATRWLRTATKADLLARIAASVLSLETRQLVQAALDTALRLEAERMADAISLVATDEILSRPDHHPFASPHYWAAFAAWGAVV